MPIEIGRLTILTDLNLRGNKLTSLPAEIVKLQNLEELNLLGNPISEIERKRLLKLLEMGVISIKVLKMGVIPDDEPQEYDNPTPNKP